MTISALLIANRGEIAIRIARAADELGIRTVAVYSEDDAASLHKRAVTAQACLLPGRGASAYLNQNAIVAAAREMGCDAIHPGYGFLSENADFARLCEAQGLTFVGPTPETLAALGDKARARALARSLGVPLVPGTFAATGLDEAKSFFSSAGGAVMIKALAGGGGRGMRVVHRLDDLDEAYARCSSEAEKAFGNDAVYVEKLVGNARHIEVQIVGDGREVAHAFERECTIQRRHQKLIEIAPSPTLAAEIRDKLLAAAVHMAAHFSYRGLGTFEFLVDADPGSTSGVYFIEANPRLQVEHTVTEEVTGVDLVRAQIEIASGRSLAELGLTDIPQPRGFAVEARINTESMAGTGEARPEGGALAVFEPPTGPGIRIDTYGYGGYRTNSNFDSLIAKVIAHAPDFRGAVARARRALTEFRIEGVTTNIDFLLALLDTPEVVENRVHTRFVEERIGELLARIPAKRQEDGAAPELQADAPARPSVAVPEGAVVVAAPLNGTIFAVDVVVGEVIRPGQRVALVEAMKMEHVVAAEMGGVVRLVAAQPGATLNAGEPILYIEPSETAADELEEAAAADPAVIRPDLASLLERRRVGLDEARPEAVARRRARGQRTARENIADLTDPGSFAEYGALAVAAQRQRRTTEELIAVSPADGLVAGIGTINAALFGAERARAMALAYDFTVFAGTQGWMNHKKKDRLFELAHQWRLPVVLFAEGGGGRPGETDGLSMHGLDTPSFARFAKLGGLVPLVGIVSGRCFAGNAALVGCCDVIIATRNANLGMGGPAMIEGGGLGVFEPEDIGPVGVQGPNGNIDLIVEDEAEAVAAAKRYLAFVQGSLPQWRAADQHLLRQAIPENRRRAYDIRRVIDLLADEGSTLELRHAYGRGMVTALIRVEGRAVGLMANNPAHLGGAIDAPAAEKAARFMTLCNAYRLPMLSLCDTPGFMVGPAAEKAGQVRSSCAMFLAAAKLDVPFLTVVLRKGYGLGAQSMAAGSFHEPLFTVAWPTGEFGGMGLEGAVRLGYRKELDAIADPAERQLYFEEKLKRLYHVGEAVNMAAHLEIDAVIDPADTRAWITRGLNATAASGQGA